MRTMNGRTKRYASGHSEENEITNRNNSDGNEGGEGQKGGSRNTVQRENKGKGE